MTKDNVFDDIKEEGDVDNSTKHTLGDGPAVTNPEWNDYVLSLFEKDELVDDKPIVAGLRRVAEIVLGRIVESRPIQVFPATSYDTPGRATVVYQVTFESGLVFGDVADCWDGNTDDEFVVYNTATASTRAEARALRKALKLRSVAAEEITSKNTAQIAKQTSKNKSKVDDGEFKSDTLASDKQHNFIGTLCDRAGINRDKLLLEVFEVEDATKLLKNTASEAIDLLNSYNNKSKDIPESIKN